MCAMVRAACAIPIQLHCNYAPKTCENFMSLCRSGYYNDVVFHRSIRNFMVGDQCLRLPRFLAGAQGITHNNTMCVIGGCGGGGAVRGTCGGDTGVCD